jgi:putative protease
MKIAAPASSIKDAEMYFRIKADEIYLGLESNGESLNKRSEKNANFTTAEDIKKARTANPFSEISFTLNSPFYDDKQLEEVKKQVIETRDRVDNYIIADASLIETIKKLAPEKGIIISCIGTCFNSKTAELYTRLGAKKIILPRHFSAEEIEKITAKNPSIKFEAMVLNQFCRNIDGFCTRHHISGRSNCNIPFSGEMFGGNEKAKKNIASILTKHRPECGLCFIERFEKAGLDSVKIVGRDHTTERKEKDARLVRGAIKNPEKCRELFEKAYFKCTKENCHY